MNSPKPTCACGSSAHSARPAAITSTIASAICATKSRRAGIVKRSHFQRRPSVRGAVPQDAIIAAITASSAAPTMRSASGESGIMRASVSAETTMPAAVIRTSESASVTLVNTVSRPTCAGVTSAAP